MNRIYLPYSLELLAKVISWTMVLVIDLIEFILAPFMRIGAKFVAVYAVFAAVFSGYAHWNYNFTWDRTAIVFGALLVGFLAALGIIRLTRHILIKRVRPPFANIVFESVAVSFRRPRFYKKVKI